MRAISPSTFDGYALRFILLAGLCGAQVASAQAPSSTDGSSLAEGVTLTEAKLLQALRERDPLVRYADTVASAQEARGRAAGAHPNPEVSWAREDLGSGDEREDTLSVALPLALGGSRYAARAQAMAEAASSRAELVLEKSGRTLEMLALFYRGVAASEAARIVTERLKRLEEAERVLSRRFEEGSASGYEKSRMSLAVESARHDAFQASQSEQRYRAAFLPLVEDGAEVRELEGTLTLAPSTTRSTEPTREHTLSPSEEAARQALAHSRDAQDAASWAFLPSISLMGGYKRVTGTTEAMGYVAGVSIELPILDHGQGARADADHAHIQITRLVERQAQERTTQRTMAEMRLRSLRTEQDRLRQATSGHAARIIQAAESGYREGTVSITELLDAHEARTENEQQALALALDLKLAELALRAAQGEFEQ